MNDYQKQEAAAPGNPPAHAAPAEDYAARLAESDRRYRALRESCMAPPGAAMALCSLALGMLAVEMLLLYPSGLGMLLLAAGAEALVFGFFHQRAGRDQYLLGCLLLLTAAGYPLHYTPSSRLLCSLGICCTFALQLCALEGEKSSPLSAPALLSAPGKLIGEPITNLGLPFSALKGLRTHRSRAARAGGAILLGTALALPVCGVLLALFASADAAFASAMEGFFYCLQLTPASVFCDILFGGALGLLLAARLLKARFTEAGQPAQEKQAVRIPALVSGSFLGCICTVCCLFICFQFVYLFGGEAARAASDITYSDYARRGFFELCAASALIFLCALLALLFTRPDGKGRARGIRILAAALCVEDFLILLSALRRMALYVSAYGLSIKRALALWGMLVVAAGLILLLIRCLKARFDILRALLIAGLAALCLLSLGNTERAVARWNVRQMSAGSIPFDSGSFRELGYTAAPQLEQLAAAFPEKAGEIDAILSEMDGQLQRAHPLYSFSFDQPGARAVFRRRLIGRPS